MNSVTLLDYHYWASDRVLDAVEPVDPEKFTRDLGNSFRSVRDTLAHIYAAEWVWHSRWRGSRRRRCSRRTCFRISRPSVSCGAISRCRFVRSSTSWGEDGIHRGIEYKLLSGQPGASIFWHMLQHVVNHATYHRGQVTTMLRQLGALPPKGMDLIAFYREKHF